MLRVGMGPGMVEHELTVRIALAVSGRGGNQRVAVPQRQVLRLPAIVRAKAAARFQSSQEGMGDKRIAPIVQRIPLLGGNVRQRVDDARLPHLTTVT